jgi:outer membrane lipoprotein SlyB
MLSDSILRSTAAFGGAPFRFKKCTALSSAAGGAAAGSAVGGVPGALVGGALGVASSLLGGLFGSHNTNKVNQMNYRIMQEQNRFNADEAKKNRDWHL